MNMKVNLAGVELKNPVMEASGTFGSGAEYGEFVNLSQLGAVVTKGLPIFHGLEIRHHELRKLPAVCSMPSAFRIRESMCL